MLQIFQSLGRLSIKGHLLIGSFLLIAVLATYSNIHDMEQLAAKQQKQQTTNQARADELGLDNATTDSKQTAASTSSQSLSTNTNSSTTGPSEQSSPVAQARHQAGTLVFTPASITISLSRTLPAVTVTSSDGSRISTPEITATNGSLGLVAQKTSSSASPSWQMQFSGKSTPGAYQLTLHATGVNGGVTTEYTGTLTVVVIL